jgi:hypothetical protein
MRIKIWKGMEEVDFWMPVEAMVNEEMKITRAISNRFSVSKNKDRSREASAIMMSSSGMKGTKTNSEHIRSG